MVSLGLFVISVLAATATKLTKLKPVRRGLLILGRNVVAALTVGTLKYYVVSRHFLISNFRLPIANLFSPSQQLAIGNWQSTMPLLNNFRYGASTNRATAFTNCEAQSLLHRDWRN